MVLELRARAGSLYPRPEGILVQLGEDHALDIVNATYGITARDCHLWGLQLLVWRPHVDFAALFRMAFGARAARGAASAPV